MISAVIRFFGSIRANVLICGAKFASSNHGRLSEKLAQRRERGKGANAASNVHPERQRITVNDSLWVALRDLRN